MRFLSDTAEIAAPVELVWAAWRQLGAFPGRTETVTHVGGGADGRSEWTVHALGETRRWTAEITDEVPCRRIEWRAVDGLEQRGVVTFHRLGPERTRVAVQIEWEPHGTFELTAANLGIDRRRLHKDLEHLAERIGAEVARIPRATVTGTGRADLTTSPRTAGDRRGLAAESPAEIPKLGWKEVLQRTKVEIKDDNMQMLAGGVAFYFFLAAVPALVALLSIYGLIATPADVSRMVGGLGPTVPGDVKTLLDAQLKRLTQSSPSGLGIGVVVSLLAALWSASKGAQALIRGTNAAYDEREKRKGWKVKLLALGFTVGFVALFVAGGFVVTTLPDVLDPFGPAARVTISVLRWPALAALMMLGLAVLYRYGPSRDEPKWRWVSVGSVTATVFWVVGSAGFAWYANSFGSFNKTYGTLGAVVVLLLWFQLTAFVVLLGAELNAEAEHQTAADTTEGRPQPLGTRGAVVADDLPPVEPAPPRTAEHSAA
jgi:membrane protein